MESKERGSAAVQWFTGMVKDVVQDQRGQLVVDRDIALLVHDNVSLIRAALLLYAKQCHTDGLALTSAASSEDQVGGDSAQQRRRGVEMMNHALRAEQLGKELSELVGDPDA